MVPSHRTPIPVPGHAGNREISKGLIEYREVPEVLADGIEEIEVMIHRYPDLAAWIRLQAHNHIATRAIRIARLVVIAPEPACLTIKRIQAAAVSREPKDAALSSAADKTVPSDMLPGSFSTWR